MDENRTHRVEHRVNVIGDAVAFAPMNDLAEKDIQGRPLLQCGGAIHAAAAKNNVPLDPVATKRIQSARRVTIGSVREARRAGTYPATAATIDSVISMSPNDTGSLAVTP